ncbi:Ger(x)C family spore germination protein [Paenibacillus sp. FJAT-27812]|uniref:Ger(x)C family spore germination protein n=1 Tax=Paenibacillus sp. FJAT-27812 TaxID=1684143 RepID=UPI0006A7D5D7|nr:Ger(x)C family spore germination protein [Paenibacillus sp. FJAT-27812]
MKHAAAQSRRVKLWKKSAALISLLISTLLLQGCWDEINLQDVSYISALGIDFKDGKYEIYGQTIKFGLIAKTESLQPDPNPVWIGRGTGDSILLALNNLTRSGQSILSLEHLKTVVIQARALEKIDDIMDGLNRQRASRYTSLIYGTKDTIEKIFTTDTFYDQSPLNSIMYMPQPLEGQRSFIRPSSLQVAVQTLKEPAMVTTFAALTANENQWTRKKLPLQIQMIEGVFVFKELKYLGYLSEEEASGLRWINPEFKHFILKAESEHGSAAVNISSSKSSIQTSFKGNSPNFVLKVKMSGAVAEVLKNMNEDEIVASIEAKVKQQLESTYRKGLTKGMDLFRLEHNLYRYHYAFWKKECKGKEWLPKPEQINIVVKFNVTHSGNFGLDEDGT